MSNPFLSINLVPSYHKGNMLEWRVDPAVALPDDVCFLVELSETSDFKEPFHVAEVKNSFFYLDDTNTKRSHQLIIYYRVSVTIDKRIFFSETVTNIIQDYSRRQYVIAMELARKEFLRLSKFVGKPAALYKFRNYSTTQTDNSVDPVTGLALTAANPDFGNSKKSGYYAHVWTYFSLEAHEDVRRLDPGGTGLLEATQADARTAGFPTVETNDLIYEKEQDRCWLVKDRQALYAPGSSLVIAQSLKLMLLPPSDPVYSLPNFKHKYEQTI